jgi:hypothetical protein
MKITIRRLLMTTILGSGLMIPTVVVPTALRADDKDRDDKDRDRKERIYRDKKHNDEHHWNDHEDKAFRMYSEQNHRPYKDFHRLNERDQQSYWDWRHDHSDSELKIEIH